MLTGSPRQAARPVFRYFGYGSNLDLASLKAKGVVPLASCPARLRGWRLCFDVEHFFRHEGGVGNIRATGNPGDCVLGLLHECEPHHLAALDRAEARGVGYDRIVVALETAQGRQDGFAYVGLPAYVNERCLPTRRYINILLRGAIAAGLDADYIAALRAQPILELADPAPFRPSQAPGIRIDHTGLSPHLTVLAGSVFDMGQARPAHAIAKDWFGGKDVTLFLLRRLDSSDGCETLADVLERRLRPDQVACINAYLHAFDQEYRYVGQFDYASLPGGKQLG